MHLERLTPAQSKIVGEMRRAAADGPFFPDWEFYALFGLTREQVREIADAWPLPILPPEDVAVAVSNAFNNLLGYPHHKHEVWPDWISVDYAGADALFNVLRGRRR